MPPTPIPAVAEEIDSDGIPGDAVRHTGDLSRKQLHDLTIGEELKEDCVARAVPRCAGLTADARRTV